MFPPFLFSCHTKTKVAYKEDMIIKQVNTNVSFDVICGYHIQSPLECDNLSILSSSHVEAVAKHNKLELT